jgi:hypothetical protein
MKIIWHFKDDSITYEKQKEAKSIIKEFHEKSLVVYSADLDIHILRDEYHKKEIEEKDFFEGIDKNKNGYRNKRTKFK